MFPSEGKGSGHPHSTDRVQPISILNNHAFQRFRVLPAILAEGYSVDHTDNRFRLFRRNGMLRRLEARSAGFSESTVKSQAKS